MTGGRQHHHQAAAPVGGDDGDDERRLDRPGRGLDGGSGRRVDVRHERDGSRGRPTDRLAYRISAGYFRSDAFPRPTGQIPVVDDPRVPGETVGGALYPEDRSSAFADAFANRGTSQPKFDVRVDQDLADGRISYSGGVAGTEGLVHTGVGPFDVQRGSYLGYAKVGVRAGATCGRRCSRTSSTEARRISCCRIRTRGSRSISGSSPRPSMRRSATRRSSASGTT